MAETIHWGATPEEWRHISKALGLTEHMLPVVSNPHATVWEDSKLQTLGKAPSFYDGNRKVVGIRNWPNRRSTPSEVANWSRVPDYGICLQTREVRAFDIDITDPATASKVTAFINEGLILDLPCRGRSNSAKCLLAVRIIGELSKRTIPVGDGMIEFLATGQQFIAAGKHTSGVRYEWAGGLPAEIPEVTTDEFEALWAALTDRFGTAPGTNTVGGNRMRDSNRDISDPVADHLVATGRSLGKTKDGDHNVACPWSAEHTSGADGDTSTTWFRAGSKGHTHGNFVCLHGHCRGKRTREEFFTAVGYFEAPDEFEDVVLEPGETGGPSVGTGAAAGIVETAPLLTRKKNRVDGTIGNLLAALEKPIFSGMRVRHDRFRDAIMFCRPGSDQYEQFTDMHYTELRRHFEVERRFQPISKDMTRDAVLAVAKKDYFDSAMLWLSEQIWDGVPRVEQFLTTYFGVPDSAYARAVSRYIWTALAGRTMDPGCKADMVPILVGAQGARKSSAVAAMVVSSDFFAELQLDSKEDDMSRKMRGCQIAELAELQGLHTKALESIKAFVTRQHESWVPKYQEFSTKFPRRLLFIGTTNQDEFLADETGNRRWLPVRVDGLIDVDGIVNDRAQLWAEGAEMYLVGGVEYRDAEALAAEVHADHMITDLWHDPIAHWLDAPDPTSDGTPRTREYLLTSNVLLEALGIEAKAVHRGMEMRVGKVLQALGYTRTRRNVNKTKRWIYVRQ